MSAVLVDGREEALVDALDRGLHYGDGLFETIAARDGRPRFLDWHLERLAAGAGRLGIPLPPLALLRGEIEAFAARHGGVVKLVVTRGTGARGYRPAPDARARRILLAAPWPDRPAALWTTGARVGWCRMRLGRNARLAGIKHLNRLEQVLARAEWEEGALDEGLLRDEGDLVIGATQANVVARIDGRWVTPALDRCGVAGVMRRAFMTWAAQAGEAVREAPLPATALAQATALVLTNALIGAWPVREFDGRPLTPDPAVARFHSWLERK